MLGGFFALLAAAMFALNNASARRGMLTGSVSQALSITVPIGVPLFFVAALAFGYLGTLGGFSVEAVLWLALAGIVHFVWGRYCNFRATKAIGSNLVAPVQQSSLIVTLALAIWILGERLTLLRLLGIGLVVLGPALAYERAERKHKAKNAIETGPAGEIDKRPRFRPNYAEGYFFAALSSTGYGVSPILVSMGLETKGLAFSLAAGLISYLAATLAFALVLLWPGQLRHLRAMDPESAKWFTVSGILVCLSQMFRYMALAVAPVSVVVPIERLALVFRLYFSRLINPRHEMFGGRVIMATVVSLLGALALSVSTEIVQSILPLPDFIAALLDWHWP
jgi:uncharacterized membrane protein